MTGYHTDKLTVPMRHVALWTTRLLVVLVWALLVHCTSAHAGARVCVARAENIFMPDSLLAPPFIYPEGKLDYKVIEKLLDDAMVALSQAPNARAAWCSRFSPTDRVGIQLDVGALPVHKTLLEAVTLRLLACGVEPGNIIVYSGEETSLFRAGFDLSGAPGRVRVMGADAEGYRKGISRIVLDHCSAIINLARLRSDPRLGMFGVLANYVQSIPYEERERLLRTPEQLPSAAALAPLKTKTRLHLMDALRPGLGPGERPETTTTWVYGGVMVSDDPVALDTIGHAVLLEKLREADASLTDLSPPVVYLEPAQNRYRLGVADPQNIELTRIGP